MRVAPIELRAPYISRPPVYSPEDWHTFRYICQLVPDVRFDVLLQNVGQGGILA